MAILIGKEILFNEHLLPKLEGDWTAQYLPREVTVIEYNLLRQVFEWYENVFEYA